MLLTVYRFYSNIISYVLSEFTIFSNSFIIYY